MKRIPAIVSIAFLALIVVALCVLRHDASTSQAEATVDGDTGPDKIVGCFPVINGLIATSEDLVLLLDSGSDLSQLTPAGVQALKDAGARVDSAYCPVVWFDTEGKMRLSTKRYTVDLPVHSFALNVDADGEPYYQRTALPDRWIRSANFVPAVAGVNVLGLDLMSKF